MGHSIKNTSVWIDGNFRLNDGSQSKDYALMSATSGQGTWTSFTASPFLNRRESRYVGELYEGGIIVAIWRDGLGERCLIAGLKVLDYQRVISGRTYINYGLSWSSAWNTTPQPKMRSNHFGLSNSVAIAASYSNSAAQKCLDYVNEDLGIGIYDDWYLPAGTELLALSNNSAIFNSVAYSFARQKSLRINGVINENSFTDTEATSYTTTSVSPAQIDLFTSGPARYKRNITNFQWNGSAFVPAVPAYSSLELFSDDIGGYHTSSDGSKFGGTWSSPLFIGVGATAVGTGIPMPSYKLAQIREVYGSDYIPGKVLLKVRPFRIADTLSKQVIKFDADWAIITYEFNGIDLDTRTRMIFPTQGVTPFEQFTESTWSTGFDEYSSNWIGYTSDRPWVTLGSYDYTPGISNTIPAPAGRYNGPGTGNNVSGDKTILWSSGDNRGSGSESIAVNLNAFKFHFPGQSTIKIDCRAWWFVSNPTKPCNISVNLYKGGTLQRKNNDAQTADYFVWQINGFSASYSVASYPVSVKGNDDPTYFSGSAGWTTATRLGILEYNVVTKIGALGI